MSGATKKVWIISDRLVYVPIKSPAKPMITIIKFLNIIIAFERPVVSLWNVQYSTIAGNANPNADKHNAPNKLMNNSRFGIATANKTESKIQIE